MKEKSGVKLALVASGSGTDADSIMKAWRAGCIPEVDNILLISTKEGAGCLNKASAIGIATRLVSCKGPSEALNFSIKLRERLDLCGINLVFLVGCVHKVIQTRSDDDIATYNIHPADPYQHGGQGMYGLKVHEHVFKEIGDEIARGKKKVSDKFFTYPTIHRAVGEYDAGDILLQGVVEIPAEIIKGFMDPVGFMDGELSLKEAAKALQKHVLPYEWMILPPAVRMAARRIIERKGG